MHETPDATAAYRQRVDQVLALFESNDRNGLNRQDASARLERFGRNELTAELPIPPWRRFLAQFQDVLVVLLLIATAVSFGLWLVERDETLPYEAIAIFAVVLLNAAMGYTQEARAEEIGRASCRERV